MFKLQIAKTLYQIKINRTGYLTIPTILKRNEMSNFSRLLNASARITYMSERILSYRFLNVSLSFRAQSVKETCLRFVIFNFSEKLQNIFEIGFKKIWDACTKIVLIEKIYRRHVFVVYELIYPLSKFGGNRTNSL